MNILTTIAGHAETTAHSKAAFIFLRDGEAETARLSFASLARSSALMAQSLLAFCRPGDRVLIAVPDGVDFIQVFLACQFAGVVAVPVKPPQNREASRKVLSIADNCTARVVVCDHGMVHRLQSFFPAHPALAHMRHVDFDALVNRADAPGDDDAVQRTHAHARTLDPHTLAYLQYTSGSTGDPKGVMVSHANVMANEAMIQRRWGSGPDDVCLSWLPMFHDMGLIAAVLHTCFTGATCVLMPPMAFVQKPSRWMAAAHRYRATITGGPNFALRAIASPRSIDASRGLDLSCLRVVYCGSEPISTAIVTDFLQRYAPMGFDPRAFSAGYGLAEATLMVSAGGIGTAPVMAGAGPTAEVVPCLALPPRAAGPFVISCGELLQPQTVRIVDPATRLACDDGHVGEVWIHGDHVARGYWQNPQATADVFHATLANDPATPFLRTGDLGCLRHGELFITGRIKELMIFNGSNRYPQDIEEAVAGCHDALSLGRCVAFSLREGDAEESLHIVQEVNRDHARRLSDTDEAEIGEAIRRAVYARHQLPVRDVTLVRLNSIPRTTSGKICRVSCKRQYEANALEPARSPAAESVTDEAA